MTIKEAIKRIDEHNYIHQHKEPRAVYITEALNMAIDTMNKYQKIKEIVTQWQNETDPKIKFARSNMEKIKEVIEYGKID